MDTAHQISSRYGPRLCFATAQTFRRGTTKPRTNIVRIIDQVLGAGRQGRQGERDTLGRKGPLSINGRDQGLPPAGRSAIDRHRTQQAAARTLQCRA